MNHEEPDIIEGIARDLASVRVDRDKAWAEFTLVSVVALLGIPTLCFKLGLIGDLAFLIIAGIWMWIAYCLKRTVNRQLELDIKLFDHDDSRAVGLLFESLPYAGGAHKAEVREALKRMLPLVTSRSTNTFSWEQRAIMRKTLLYGGDDDLSLAILECYERTGGRFEREVVLMLADGILTRTRDRRIQRVARECLYSMDPHYRELEDDQNLLRPSEDPEFKLLRPSVATPFAADHLLRPAE